MKRAARFLRWPTMFEKKVGRSLPEYLAQFA